MTNRPCGPTISGMLSVIVCSGNPALRDLHERNVTKTVGTACEYLRVNNAAGNLGICAAYNLGVERARGDTLVFVHEDVFFLQRGWGPLVQAKFDADPSLGLVGLAGTTYLFADCLPWFAAGRPFLRGQVVHEQNGSQHLTVFSRDPADAEVVAADGLFLAIRRELFRDIRFDEQRFDKFHLYDMDICMQVRRTHRLIVTCDVKVKHLSGGRFDDTWRHYARRFREKYVHDLPAACTTQVPDLGNRIDFEALSLPDYYPTITEEESPMTILQIHDSEQSSAFFAQPQKLLMVRYQPIREADRSLRPGWDLLFYAPQRDQLFVVLDYQRYPYLVPPLSLPVQPGLRQVDEIPFPLSVTGERLIPGLWDYSTTVHHLKRYQLARENLRPGSVLDCACGVGYGIQMMLHERTVARAVGVDLSEFALDFSRRLVKDPRAQFSRDLPPGRFDNITCFETLEHVPDPYAFMASLVERLAPGGRFFLSVPTERWGGNHLNAFHMSNWNASRLVRFLAGFFGKITLQYQQVFLRATDTFSASEIRADSWGPNEDEYLIAVLEEPRIAPRPRTILRQNGSLRHALWTTPILERVKRKDPSRDVPGGHRAQPGVHRQSSCRPGSHARLAGSHRRGSGYSRDKAAMGGSGRVLLGRPCGGRHGAPAATIPVGKRLGPWHADEGGHNSALGRLPRLGDPCRSVLVARVLAGVAPSIAERTLGRSPGRAGGFCLRGGRRSVHGGQECAAAGLGRHAGQSGSVCRPRFFGACPSGGSRGDVRRDDWLGGKRLRTRTGHSVLGGEHSRRGAGGCRGHAGRRG